MDVNPAKPRRFRPRVLLLALVLTHVAGSKIGRSETPASVRASPEFESAVALLEQKRFAPARVALEKIVQADPQNAAACHALGRAWAAGPDAAATETSVKWFGRAAELAPRNANYLSAHGRALLRLAGSSSSLSAATKGRAVLEQAVTVDPAQLDAREALIRFYRLAPWPLGSRAKADEHLAEIGRRDPARAAELLVQRAEDAVQRRSRGARDFVGDRAIADAATPEAQRKLRALRAAMEPAPAPVELARVSGERVFLSDVTWLEAKVGWGQPARNQAWFDEKIRDGVLLTLRGKFFAKGLYAHSPSRFVFALDGQWRTFSASVGLRDGAHPTGSARFVVRGDGRELYRSPVLRVDSPIVSLNVSVAGVARLELVAEGTEGHSHNSWAIWTDPQLER